jgi:hypothetical protein
VAEELLRVVWSHNTSVPGGTNFTPFKLLYGEEPPNQEILEDQLKGKWAEELPRVVWSHNTSVLRGTNFTPFKLSYGEEPVTSEEIKLRSSRTRSEAIYSPTEAKSNDLLEPEQIKVVDNLQSYQNEMRAWRDKTVKQKSIKVGDLVLLRSPRTVASIKLESK